MDIDIDNCDDLQDGDAWGNNQDDCYLSDTIHEEEVKQHELEQPVQNEPDNANEDEKVQLDEQDNNRDESKKEIISGEIIESNELIQDLPESTPIEENNEVAEDPLSDLDIEDDAWGGNDDLDIPLDKDIDYF
jgi:hypothetical protein